MSPADLAKMTGAEQLRAAAGSSEWWREDFCDRFTAAEMLALWRALVLCEWDFFPDQWTEAQVQGALRGFVPEWSDDEEPRFLPLLVECEPEDSRPDGLELLQ